MTNRTDPGEKQGNQFKGNLLILITAILLTIAGVVVTLFIGSNVPTHYDTIEIPGYSDINLKEGEEDLDIVLRNPAGNPCSFRYDLLLSETGELLYSSSALMPGEEIGVCSITRPFTAGEYPVDLVLNCASLENGTNINTANIKLTMKVIP